LKSTAGNSASDYGIQQWYYLPTENYGGPKMDLEKLEVKKVTISPDRRKARLQLSGMKEKHVVYVRLSKKSFTGESGQSLWATEAWYTMNSIPREVLP
jgi:cytochrome c